MSPQEIDEVRQRIIAEDPALPTGKILGKRAPQIDRRTLRLAKYLQPSTLPSLPEESSWVTHVPSWPMMLNDQLGDCVIAAAGHMVQQWTSYAQVSPVIPTNQQVLSAYEDVGGYVPGQPDTDQGCVMIEALKYWRNKGIAGHKSLAFMAIDPSNQQEMQAAIHLFGNAYIGLALPISASDLQWWIPDGGPNNDGAPGSWGGHCVPLMAYSPLTYTCITWGQTLKMSHNFLLDYCDEAYAVLSKDWLESAGSSPGGFDIQQLEQDLAAL